MNRIYRSIWSDKTGAFIAVSENAKSAGKKSSSCTIAMGASARFTLKALTIFLMMSFGVGANVYALPVGGAVSAGSASISSGAGSTTITQMTPSAAINWQSFNVAPGEAVRFVQPNSNSVALNRVLGSDPSSILGSLSANGKVFLVNPNGILFGKGAQVNVGGLVASTLNITDNDFMAGRYNFAGAGGATILNQGSINADGGYVALLGANVSNEGVISAKLGTVALAAGTAITLDVAGDGLLNVTVNQGAVNALVQNGGLIRADGGQVLLTAQSAENLLQSAVNNTGVIQAQTIENHNGTIKLLGDMQSGTVNVGGTLDASGMGAGQTGGSVTATGQHVGLFDQAKIAASGDAGGGTVLIGGDFQGKNPNVPNAAAIFMGKDVVIGADAINTGNGGKVILWSDSVTKAYGAISAHGGAQSGNGGLIETSGHYLDVASIGIDAGTTHGTAGTWLLDPWNVNITGVDALGGFVLAGGTDTWTPTASGSTISNLSINAILNAGTNVSIQTLGSGGGEAGTITVSAPITRSTPGALTTLTLTPDQGVGGTIAINAAISGSAGAPLGVALAGASTVAVSAPVTTFGGNFSSTGTTFTNLGGAITTAGGKVDILHSTTVAIAANITTNGGNFKSTGSTFDNTGGAIDTHSGAATGGTLTIDQSATVSLAAPLTTNGADILVRVGTTFADTTTINAGTSTVTIQPQGNATTIGVGTNTSTLIITNTEINAITAGSLVIGNTTGTAAINIGTNEVVNFGTKNVTIQQAAGGITAQTNSVTGSGSMTFNAGTGTFTNSVAVNTTGAISITADDLVTSANVGFSTAGAVVMRPSTAAQPVNIASGAAGLSITEAEVNFLRGSGANTGTLTIGSSTSSATMTIASVTSLAIVGSGGMFLTNGAAMNFSGPVSAVSPFAAQTTTGNITLSNPLTTTNTSASAIVLNAGAGAAAGTTTGGDIIISGGTLSVGVGGRATLFTGSLAGSTGLTTLVGLGSGNFRYNSDETTTNYTVPLGAGTYAVYREQPTLTITAGSPAAITYGTATPALTTALSGLQNGDTAGQALSTVATVAVAGPISSSGNYAAVSHTLTPSGAVDQLGYALSYANGALTVGQLALTGSIATGSSVYGAALAPGAASLTGVVSGDAVTPAAVTVTPDVISTSGHLTAGSHIGIESVSSTLGGTDAGNYTFAGAVGNYTVSQLALTGSIATGSSVYGAALAPGAASFSNVVGSDAVTPGAVTVTPDVVSTSGHLTAGSHIGIESVSSTLGGTDAGNYTFAGAVGNYTVSQLALTGSVAAGSSVYGAALAPGAASLTGVVSGDVVTPDTVAVNTTGQLSTSGHLIAGSHLGIESVSSTLGGADAGNYTFAGAVGNYTVSQLNTNISGTRVYDATPTAAGTNLTTISALLAGDSVTVSGSGAVATKDVGVNKAVTNMGALALASTDAGNYNLVAGGNTLTVTPAPLVITANPDSKTYNSLAYSGGNGVAYTSFVNGETTAVLGGALTYGGTSQGAVNAGGYLITPSGQSSTNYAISYISGTLTVIPLVLTGSITAADKTYDATAAAAITGHSLLAGVLGTDVVSYSGGTATFDTPAVGTGKTVTGTGLGLSGADAGNYTVNSIATTTATIRPVVAPVVPPAPPVIVPDETTPVVVPGVPPVAVIVLGETTSTAIVPEEMLGVEQVNAPAAMLVIVPTWMPVVVLAKTPTELLTVVPAIVPPAQPIPVPVETPPMIYVPPLHLRKQDRN